MPTTSTLAFARRTVTVKELATLLEQDFGDRTTRRAVRRPLSQHGRTSANSPTTKNVGVGAA